MNIRRTAIATAVAFGFAIPVSGVALAQESAPAAPAPGAETQPAAPAAQNFTEDTLKSFAVAFVETEKVSQEYRPRMAEAQESQDQEQIQEIQREASQKMVDAVESTDGISVQEYTSVMQAAQTDPDLAQKVSGFIQEASGGAAPAQ